MKDRPKVLVMDCQDNLAALLVEAFQDMGIQVIKEEDTAPPLPSFADYDFNQYMYKPNRRERRSFRSSKRGRYDK